MMNKKRSSAVYPQQKSWLRLCSSA